MGGKSTSSSTTSQTAQTNPYGPAQGPLNSLLGQLGGINPNLTGAETGALDSLQANANAGNPFASQISGVAGNLLGGGTDRTGMVNDAYSQYQQSLAPTARGDFVNPESNPQLQSYLSTIQNDVANRVNGAFASAGRDFSGAHMNALGKGITTATAPILYDAYNQARNQQLTAQNNLFGAGASTAGLLSGLDQTALGNQQAGIDAASRALQANDSPFMQTLALEAQRRGIPMQNIQSLLSSLGPIAEAFGEKKGTATTQGEQQMSGAQQFAMIAQGLGSLFGGGQQKPQPTSWGF